MSMNKNILSIKDKWLIKWENLRINPNSILLDYENPRFWFSGKSSETQDELIISIVTKFWIPDLLSSISNNWYFDEEPLVVVPKDDKYIVVEWNRRLTAIKLLLEKEKYEALFSKHKIKLNIPIISNSVRSDIEDIPVISYRNRNDILVYLGVRHISWVEPWWAYAKWVYVSNLIEQFGTNIDEISDIIGDWARTIWHTYVAFKLLEQFKELRSDLDISPIEDNFSYLQLLVWSWTLKNYIGLKPYSQILDLNNPIPIENIKQLEEMFGWMFWVGWIKVIQESREIRKLWHVIIKQASLEKLKESNNLEEAHAYSDWELTLLDKRFRQLEKMPMEIRNLLSLLHSNPDTKTNLLEHMNEVKYQTKIGMIKELVEDLNDYIVKISV